MILIWSDKQQKNDIIWNGIGFYFFSILQISDIEELPSATL